MQSGIYTGTVRHRRYTPAEHEFRYKVFMMYLDVSELNHVFNGSLFWGVEQFKPARFKRRDFFGDPKLPLDVAVRQRIEEETGYYPEGAIRLLSNLRYFGYSINPISCYYIFNKENILEYMLVEVTNTPWGERCSYVLCCDTNTPKQHLRFNKDMHVSPFNPMDIIYDWKSNDPGYHAENGIKGIDKKPRKKLFIHMENVKDQSVIFDATLLLRRKEITGRRLDRLILLYPFMTLKVVLAIYWQALRLWLKKVPFFRHPNKINGTHAESIDVKNKTHTHQETQFK